MDADFTNTDVSRADVVNGNATLLLDDDGNSLVPLPDQLLDEDDRLHLDETALQSGAAAAAAGTLILCTCWQDTLTRGCHNQFKPPKRMKQP